MLKIVFFGTTDFAVTSLDALSDAGFEILAVVTTVDKMGGRGHKEVLSSAVKKYASEKQMAILQPKSLRGPKFLKKLSDLQADLFVVVAFRMLPMVVWSMPAWGTINLHGSLLPQFRGAAPINWAIIKGVETTGVTVFFLDESIDTGQIIYQAELEVFSNDTFGSLYERMKPFGASALVKAVYLIQSEQFKPLPQDASKVSYAPKLSRENTQIDFDKSGKEVVNLCRGLNPFPGAWFVLHGMKIKVIQCTEIQKRLNTGQIDTDYKSYLHIGCSENSVSLEIIQPEGKKVMAINEFLNGYGQKLKNK